MPLNCSGNVSKYGSSKAVLIVLSVICLLLMTLVCFHVAIKLIAILGKVAGGNVIQYEPIEPLAFSHTA